MIGRLASMRVIFGQCTNSEPRVNQQRIEFLASRFFGNEFLL